MRRLNAVLGFVALSAMLALLVPLPSNAAFLPSDEAVKKTFERKTKRILGDQKKIRKLL